MATSFSATTSMDRADMLKAFGFRDEGFSGLIDDVLETYPLVSPEDFRNIDTFRNAECRLSCRGSHTYLSLLLILSGMLHSHDEYRRRKIGDDIYTDTMSDSFVWADLHHRLSGEIGLEETSWLLLHINLELFRLGRLQFQRRETPSDFRAYLDSDEVIEIHVPDIGPLTPSECILSIGKARRFFGGNLPFVCSSWLLEPELGKVLQTDSNILGFQGMFRIVKVDKISFQCHQRVFEYTARQNTSLQRRILEEEEKGLSFGVGYGILD